MTIDTKGRRAHAEGGARETEDLHALYRLDDVRSALGFGAGADTVAGLDDDADSGGLGARRAHLRGLLEKGESGRWRAVAHAGGSVAADVREVGTRAPHLRDVTSLIVRRLRAAAVTGTRISLPPTLLLGPPGVGKSWYMAQIAQVLGVPFRLFPMNLSTLADGLSGSHPCWRSSAPGLVARTLLQEDVANPLVLIDEVDKPPPPVRDGDAYRPLYALLEPECARTFVDEHLGVPIDASAVMWVMSANSVEPLPTPIVDRLVVVEVPDMSREDRMAVVASIYATANARYRGFFDPTLATEVSARLAAGNARRARLAVEDAMVRAAAAGRRVVTPADVMGAASDAKVRAH